MTTVDMLTLIPARSDGTLGPKVKTWSGACPGVMPALYLQVPRRPLQSMPASEAIDPAEAECPTGYRTGGILIDGATMSTVAGVLSLPPARALLGNIVSDQTGLTGRYTMELDYPFPPQRVARLHPRVLPIFQRNASSSPGCADMSTQRQNGACPPRLSLNICT